MAIGEALASWFLPARQPPLLFAATAVDEIVLADLRVTVTAGSEIPR
jgi:hypothetical protein